MKLVISALVVLIGLAAPAWAGFGEGYAAHNRGDFATALREWRPLAEQGSNPVRRTTRWPTSFGEPIKISKIASC